MRKIILKAPAKINLGLSILKKLPSHYHEVKTIYTQVSLFDELKIEEIDGNKIEIDCNDQNIPTDKNNLAYQVVELVKNQTKIKKGLKIFIEKNIPVGSGLGGGSSDAAQTLIGLNKLWDLGLSLERLTGLARKIGMDVAYQLQGGVKLEIQGGKETGQFTKLKALPKETLIVLCFPNLFITSPWAYQRVEYGKINKNSLANLIKAINNQDFLEINQNLHNDFELWTLKKFPLIRKIKEQMLRYGALGSLMSGKGSTVFGIFNNLEKAKLAKQVLKKDFKKTFLVKPLCHSELDSESI
ncbi:4-(cytidine 5'-diphospho)-2-C-methyl-D-erythritol kinase [Candidatus Microgenomates bacterium]|nr:4-(cytidine 5'-diphospho)-2-C-methyl-D-erythritol kinase [Candidatus Microgenomates bacterium]